MAWTPFDASTTDARSMASPLIQSHPCAPEEGLVPRANARIFQPCRASARAVSPPIPPLAPSTRAIRVDSAISSSRNLSVIDYYLPLIDSAVNKKIQSLARKSEAWSLFLSEAAQGGSKSALHRRACAFDAVVSENSIALKPQVIACSSE